MPGLAGVVSAIGQIGAVAAAQSAAVRKLGEDLKATSAIAEAAATKVSEVMLDARAKIATTSAAIDDLEAKAGAMVGATTGRTSGQSGVELAGGSGVSGFTPGSISHLGPHLPGSDPNMPGYLGPAQSPASQFAAALDEARRR